MPLLRGRYGGAGGALRPNPCLRHRRGFERRRPSGAHAASRGRSFAFGERPPGKLQFRSGREARKQEGAALSAAISKRQSFLQPAPENRLTAPVDAPVCVQPLHKCPRQFAIVRWRAFCVGRTTSYYFHCVRACSLSAAEFVATALRRTEQEKGQEKMAGGSGLARSSASLTHRSIEALRPAAEPCIEYQISECIGLAVRAVAPSGVKTWDLAFRNSRIWEGTAGLSSGVSDGLRCCCANANELTVAARAGRDLIAEEEEPSSCGKASHRREAD